MASKILTTFIDDIDGSNAAGTYTFSYQGTHYEIDLSDKNRNELEAGLKKFIDHARRLTRNRDGKQVRPSGAAVGGGAAKAAQEEVALIRAWAKRNGYSDLKDRGRVPGVIVTDYRQHGGMDKAQVAAAKAAGAAPDDSANGGTDTLAAGDATTPAKAPAKTARKTAAKPPESDGEAPTAKAVTTKRARGAQGTKRGSTELKLVTEDQGAAKTA